MVPAFCFIGRRKWRKTKHGSTHIPAIARGPGSAGYRRPVVRARSRLSPSSKPWPVSLHARRAFVHDHIAFVLRRGGAGVIGQYPQLAADGYIRHGPGASRSPRDDAVLLIGFGDDQIGIKFAVDVA